MMIDRCNLFKLENQVTFDKQELPAIYAVRIEGQNGWQIYNPPVTRDKIVAHLEKRGLKGLEFVAILVVLRKIDHIDEVECTAVADSVIMGNGWIYDYQSSCWRAPNEMYSEPSEQAVFAESFDIVSDPPEAGWWEIGFAINGKEYWISSSEVYDPLLDYHNLILAVVRGRDIRITINEESRCTDISIYCKTDGIIRFILKLLGANEQREVDVLIDGVEFVQRMYALMRGFFANSKKFAEGWLMEFEDSYQPESTETFEEYIEQIKQERGYPSYPIEDIEKYLVANQKS